MSLQDLLFGGFGDQHDSDSEGYAAALEAAAAGEAPAELRARLIHVANHTIGEHLGDWPRARRLAERVLAGRSPGAADAPAWARLATARFMAGDAAGSAEAEITYLKAAGDQVRDAYVDCKVNLAVSLIGSKRVAEGAAIYSQVVGLASEEKSAADRGLAVASNNLASELVEQPSRTAEEDALMDAAAEAAHKFWIKAGTWVNEARALYLKALVANALGRPASALEHADMALAIIEANGDEPVDAAFLHLASANALGLQNEPEAHRRELAEADALAASFDDGVKSWFAEERAKIRLL
jgi:hypothetical protein